MRPLEPCFCNAVWHLRSLSARSSLGDLRSSLQVVPPRRRFWRLLARVVLVCFGVVPSLPWAISRAGSGRTGSSRRALHGPQNLLGIGDWLLLPTACHTQAGTPPECTSRSGCAPMAICPLQVVAVDRLLTPPAPQALQAVSRAATGTGLGKFVVVFRAATAERILAWRWVGLRWKGAMRFWTRRG